MNAWRFTANLNIVVTSSASGLTLHWPATTGSPAVICTSGVPNLDAHNAGLTLQLRTTAPGYAPWFAVADELTGYFTGTAFFDTAITSRIQSTVAGVAANRLNKADKQGLYLRVLHTLLDHYIEQFHLEPRVGEATRVEFTAVGVTVTYYMSR
jgi:hypothetical protein